MEKPTFESVYEAMLHNKYVVYDNPAVDWNLNIVGVRADVAEPDKFDDWLLVFHRFSGEWDVRHYQITTDPSPHYLKKPVSADGTAILKTGQYKAAYALDIHRRGEKSAHEALCQKLQKVTVYRDNNKNGSLNMIPGSTQTGFFGINIHRGPRNGQWAEDNTNYSAGCQVFADDRKFDEFLLLCQHARDAFGNKFTYTLLDEKDVNAASERLAKMRRNV
ncbi:hypothetical protein [Pseudomonas tohonis]|uniref:hypothetical protein n=1 Tax=Pseudomonas tohonis TaxID=2725477 RepID=UPI0022F0D94E|nr:hypothetical protein [Pseudomonas tohonis]